MKATALTTLVVFMVCTLPALRAQSPITISQPELSLKGDKVQIGYDLMNTSRTERFTVRIEVTTESGRMINPRTLTGDVGPQVNGGNNKKIFWDIGADSIFLDEEVFIQVIALPELPPEPVTHPLTAEKENAAEAVPEEAGPEESVDSRSGLATKEYNRTALIMQSIAFPGLGLSRASGNPHWLRGVAGYGCLAGSVYLNRKGWNSYQDYLASEDPNAVDDLFDQAYNARKYSQILGYAAVGVWAVDLAWTVLGTSNMERYYQAMERRGISFDTTLEPLSNTPLITMRYRF